jgi:hypothetical protein
VSLFCLVHGSTQDASGWDMLVPELERRGHEVARMNLPGDTPEASATRYADLIAQSMPVQSLWRILPVAFFSLLLPKNAAFTGWFFWLR